MSRKVVTAGFASTTPASSPSGGQRSIQSMLQQEKDREKDKDKEVTLQMIFQTVQRMEQQILKIDEKVENTQQMMVKYDERLQKLEKREEQKEEKIKDIDNRLGEVERDRSGLIEWEMDKSDFYLRFQNVEEEKRENLVEIMIGILAEALEITKEKMMDGVDEIYRVYTKYTMQNKLPREVHIRFTKKSIKTQILQIAREKMLKYKEKEIAVLKQIPRRVREMQREYQFLTKVLLQKGMSYRWLVPEGLILMWQLQRYRIDTIDKARAFYTDFFKEKETEMEFQSTVVPIQLQEEELAMMEKIEGALGGAMEQKEQRELRSTRLEQQSPHIKYEY